MYLIELYYSNNQLFRMIKLLIQFQVYFGLNEIFTHLLFE